MIDSISMPSTPPEAAAPATVEDTEFWWSLTACVAWLLFPDPAAIKALCEPLRLQRRNLLDPDAGARILSRGNALRTLAHRALGTAASRTLTPMRREKIVAAALRQVPEDEKLVAVFPSHLRSRKRALRQVREDAKIDEITGAKVRELWGTLGKGYLTAVGTDSETRRRGPVPRDEFSMVPTLRDILESRVGEYSDVVVRRADLQRCWLEPVAPSASAPHSDAPPRRAPRKLYGAATGKAYREDIIAAGVEHFDNVGFDTKAEVVAWLGGEALKRDRKGISDSTAKNYAAEVIERLSSLRNRST